ncbi:facilitated trehalose transporter Tret1 [Diabrotica virgifera virgifera]|uniref:Facilitated trehalose transporter Tret1-like n=1 Tax=Diabrotica virgifera virgifera TaxID=50390 RepID=A0A6P7G6Y0_DIAVI|nr:facilitated trehalose transporter Tret1 [Diabrotica virgifera virgifera]
MVVVKNVFNTLAGTVLSGILSAMMLGTISVWSSPMIPKLYKNNTENPFGYTITSSEDSWVASIVILGACVGCWCFGLLSNVYGRKLIFSSLGIPAAISCIVMVAFPKYSVFLAARFCMGLSIGGIFELIITYFSEITSKTNRSTIMTTVGMAQSIGDLFDYSVGPWVSVTAFNSILIPIPIIFTIVAATFCKESPYFYLLKGQEGPAKKSLQAYRPLGYDVETEIIEIRAHIKEQQEGRLLDVIQTKKFAKSLFMGCTLVIFQQFTGINCILMYSQRIFELTSASLTPAICSIILGSMQLTSGAMCPVLVNFFNKKTIFTGSAIGMIISQLVLGTYCILDNSGHDMASLRFIPIVTLTLFIFSYNSGFGALCWVVASEVYPARVKSLALSFTIFIFFVMGFFIAKYFQTVVESVGIGSLFYFFSGCCVVAIIFIHVFVVETRDKSLEEIQDMLGVSKNLKEKNVDNTAMKSPVDKF